MWEAIASNRRRSRWLIGLMGAVLALLGAVIGLLVATYAGGHEYVSRYAMVEAAPPSFVQQIFDARVGAYFGIAAAMVIWLIMWATAAGAGDSILLNSAKAREIQREDAPQLWNLVEEMTIASGLGKMPRVYIVDDPRPNAFAVGYRPERAAVAVTAGLLKRLNRDELQGVIAHEIGHIRNLDVRFMTMAAVMMGAIVLISHGFLRGMFYSGGRRRSSRSGGGQAQLVMLVVAILVAVLAPLAAQLLYFSCSRRREFLADASAARFTRYPPGLASALEKISKAAAGGEQTNKVLAPMYIVNPLQAHSAPGLFSTHPSCEERIRILRSMGGAGLAAYEEAYRKVRAGQECIGARSLKEGDAVAMRDATPEPPAKNAAVARAQAVGELLDKVLPLVVIPCVCGVRLKLPAGFKADSLACPRCGRKHAVPKAEPGSPDRPAATQQPRYRRRGTGWESFQCACGHPVQLSPKFGAPEIECPKCGQHIEVAPAE